MTFQRIVLPDEEEVVRFFSRNPSALRKQIRIKESDFGRQMHRMSGISMFRNRGKVAGFENYRPNFPKGILIAKVAPLNELGLQFWVNDPEDNHLSVRCPGCDNSPIQNGGDGLCINTMLPTCSFKLDPSLVPLEIVPRSIAARLAQIFTVDLAPQNSQT